MTGKSDDSTKVRLEGESRVKVIPRNSTDEEEEMTFQF